MPSIPYIPSTAPFTPNGWGASLFEALSGCIREIYRFPYEPS
jgi:hypothetical protein